MEKYLEKTKKRSTTENQIIDFEHLYIPGIHFSDYEFLNTLNIFTEMCEEEITTYYWGVLFESKSEYYVNNELMFVGTYEGDGEEGDFEITPTKLGLHWLKETILIYISDKLDQIDVL